MIENILDGLFGRWVESKGLVCAFRKSHFLLGPASVIVDDYLFYAVAFKELDLGHQVSLRIVKTVPRRLGPGGRPGACVLPGPGGLGFVDRAERLRG